MDWKKIGKKLLFPPIYLYEELWEEGRLRIRFAR